MKKMGRPKGDNNMVKSYTIWMDDVTLARLEAYCEFMNITKSESICKAINTMVDECEEIKK